MLTVVSLGKWYEEGRIGAPKLPQTRQLNSFGGFVVALM